MEQYPAITLYRGATARIEFDLTQFALQGGFVRLTIRNQTRGRVFFTQDFHEQRAYTVLVPDEAAAALAPANDYAYDLMWHVGEERFPICAPSPVVVCETVGGM